MPAHNNGNARTINLSGKKALRAVDHYFINPMMLLMTACVLETTAYYLYPSKNGMSVKVKIYDTTPPCEAWINIHEDLVEQVEMLITEVWGEDTLREAHALMALAGLEAASKAPQAPEPTPSPSSGRKRPQRASGKA